MTASLQAELTCLQCGRTAGTMQGSLRAVVDVKITRPEHTDAVKALRCPFCSGRLLIGEIQEVFTSPRPLTDEESVPKPGRPAKPRHPCADCGTSILAENTRCRDCNDDHRSTMALATRVVLLLGEHGVMKPGDLADRLKTDPDTLRHAVRKARQAGRHIERTTHGYRLLEVAQ